MMRLALSSKTTSEYLTCCQKQQRSIGRVLRRGLSCRQKKQVSSGRVLIYIWYQNFLSIQFRSDFGYFGWRFGFEISRFQNCSIFQMVLDSVIEKIWYRIQYRKNQVSKKVLDLVLEKFSIRKKFRIRSDFGYRHTLQLCNK